MINHGLTKVLIDKLNKFKYIDADIKLDNNKYNQKLPHIYVMKKWMANNYWEQVLASESRIYRFYDKKVVICHPLCYNINMSKILVTLVVIKLINLVDKLAKSFEQNGQ